MRAFVIVASISLLLVSGCALNPQNVASARAYLERYPYWHTGKGAPSQSPEELQYEREAKAFITAHPREAVEAANQALAASPVGQANIVRAMIFHRGDALAPFLLRLLEGPAFASQGYAAEVARQLGQLRLRRAVPRLIEIGREGPLRPPVAEALGRFGDRRAVPFLCGLARDGTEQEVQAAVRALGMLRDARAIEPLGEVLLDQARPLPLRQEAARAMGRIGDRRAVPLLEQAQLPAGLDPRRNEALWALLRLAPERAPQLLRATGEVRMAKYLPRADAVPWLLDAFACPKDDKERREAMALLVKAGERSILPQIKEELLFPTDRSMANVGGRRASRLAALFDLQDPEASDICLWIMAVYGQWYYGHALADRLGPETLPYLRSRMQDPREPPREVIRGICRLGDESDKEGILAYASANPWRGLTAIAYVEDEQVGIMDYAVRCRVKEALPLARDWLSVRFSGRVNRAAKRFIAQMGDTDGVAGLLADRFSTPEDFNVADLIVAAGRTDAVPALRRALADRWRHWAPPVVAYTLARLGDSESRELLRQALAQIGEPGDPEAAWDVAGTLEAARRLADPSFVPLLKRLMEQQDDLYYKAPAAAVLASLGDEDGFETCLRVLRADYAGFPADARARETAVNGVASFPERRRKALRTLRAVALSPDEPVEPRRAALESLGTIGNASTLDLLREFPVAERRFLADAIEDAEQHLAAALETPKTPPGAGHRVCFAATMTPTETLILKYIDACARWNRVPDPYADYYHTEVLRALRWLADPRAVPVLTETAKVRSPERVKIAEHALARIATPDRDEMVWRYREGEWYERKAAVEIAARRADPRALALLVQATHDDYSAVRLVAVRALAQRTDAAVVPALLRLLGDTNTTVRHDAAVALLRLSAPGAAEAEAPALRALETDLLKDPDALAALDALRRVDSPASRGILVSALWDSRTYVRRRAARILGELGERGAVPALIAALKRQEYEAPRDRKRAQAGRAFLRGMEAIRDENKIVDIPSIVAHGLRREGQQKGTLDFPPYPEIGEALRKLTGQNFATSAEWQAWYKQQPRRDE